MKDWTLDRAAHLFFHHIPFDPRRPKWRWYEELHMWGLERCAKRHFDDPRCWVEEEINRVPFGATDE